MEQIRVKSNTGRVIIDRTITDIGSKNNFFESMNDEPESNSGYVIDKNGKIIERKKKGRLYSLGGNEPKKSHLVRMKTVGTFDLCMEVTALACGFNQDILTAKAPPVVKEEESEVAVADAEAVDVDVVSEQFEENQGEKSSQAESTSISPKRQRNISSSDNSLTVDDNSIYSQSKKFRSLSSSSYLGKHDSNEFLSKSADVLDSKVDERDRIFNDFVSGAGSASDLRANKSDDNIFVSFKDETVPEVETSDAEDFKLYPVSTYNLPLSARRRTFRKSKKIVRTDSELFKERILSQTVDRSPVKFPLSAPASHSNSMDSREDSSKNISTDTVFSDTCEEQIDLEKLENEYKEHVKSNLQREYKSDGDSLDEIGKDRHYGTEWRNQSVDFEFLENDKVDDLRVKAGSLKSRGNSKKIRNDSESRSKSEGDKDTLYSKADSTETQSTEDENKIETGQSSDPIKVEKPMSLFEKRFGKLRKMNKLLKVKRFSTSALYDKRKASEPNTSKPTEIQAAPALAALSQVTDFTSSKASLASPKSLKGKRFLLKKRKFSFFGKSQSNIDLNLKSIASKLSLLSKSNFDLSKNSSNLRLNAVGIYGKYGNNNEYRSDIIVKPSGCVSPLSEAFYNATGSYQLTPMELFEKFCSQDFTGLYKHELMDEVDENQVMETGNHNYKGAIKKSSSLRKATLLKQNSEPKFNIKNYPLDQYFANPREVFEEEEIESVENEEEEEFLYNMRNVVDRRSSYGRQLEFDQNSQYYEEDEGEDKFYENPELYDHGDEDTDEIYLTPGNLRYESGILAIDETDEETLEDPDEMLEEVEINALPMQFDVVDSEQQKLISSRYEEFEDIDSNDDHEETNLKSIISEYVKNACASAASESIARSKSMDLLSNSSETLKSNTNSDYEFDTVKKINFDSCSTSKLSLSLNSDIFDDITLAAPLDSIKPIKICEMENFTLTPDGSMSENNHQGGRVGTCQVSEQEKIKNELHSQYTIIDCDELEHDEEGEMQRFNDEKSSFAEALNKEFDKLFTRAKNDSDTDLTTTPSGATVLTAIKLPSRCSMEKLEALPFEYDEETLIGAINEENKKPLVAVVLSQSMTTTALHQSISSEKESSTKNKSKRSQSLGAVNKKKSNKCTPL